MPKEVENVNTFGCSLFTSLLTIAFIVLKLCHVINWNWFWVLSPIIIPLILGIVIGLIMVIVASKKDLW